MTRQEAATPAFEVMALGQRPYDTTLTLQKQLVEQRIAGTAPDRLLLVEHPPVITLGRGGDTCDLRVQESFLREKDVPVYRVERGGKATFHGPGQLVAYPIIKLVNKDLHAYVRMMLDVVAKVLRSFGLSPTLGVRGPGVWINGEKIASIGMAVRKWVTYHGVALNVNTDLHWFELINPCGYAEERMTSMKQELGGEVDINVVSRRYVETFREVFGFPPTVSAPPQDGRRPAWLRVPAANPEPVQRMERLLTGLHLGTVCQEANCPNLGECFARGTSTFMILGTVCTRGCRYCAVTKGVAQPVDTAEPDHVAEAVASLGIRHVVITSVTRDDLPDGGAGQFRRTILAVRQRSPEVSVEVLVPDFGGSETALQSVCDVRPDVFNHNIEVVRRLFSQVRPRASYDLSLRIIGHAADQGLATKSGLMLGLGENADEIEQTLADLRAVGCRYLTLGQYLAPSPNHVPIDRYVTPDEFADWAKKARAMGFVGVASGPLVRSSYRAEEMVTARGAQPLFGANT